MDEASAKPPRSTRATRRAFLGGLLATATAGLVGLEGLPDPLRPLRLRPTAAGEPPRNLTPRAWSTLEAVLDRLLPSEPTSPGARDVRAIAYLDAVLSDDGIDADAVARVHAAAARMDAFARSRKAPSFAALSPDAQDAGLATLEATWEDTLVLRTLLAFTLEAFLGDPVHGGNAEEIGWTWAEHRPGYPRPRAEDVR